MNIPSYVTLAVLTLLVSLAYGFVRSRQYKSRGGEYLRGFIPSVLVVFGLILLGGAFDIPRVVGEAFGGENPSGAWPLVGVVAGVVGLLGATASLAQYRRVKIDLWRYMALRVCRHLLAGRDFLWDDLVELYQKEAGGMVPDYREGRIIFAQAGDILAEKRLMTSPLQRLMQDARDSVPTVPRGEDASSQVERRMTLLILGILLLGLAQCVYALLGWGEVSSLAVLAGAVACVLTGVFFIVLLVVYWRQSNRVHRAMQSQDEAFMRQ